MEPPKHPSEHHNVSVLSIETMNRYSCFPKSVGAVCNRTGKARFNLRSVQSWSLTADRYIKDQK